MMANHRRMVNRTRAVCLAGFASILSTGAYASGFALIEQSVSGMGIAYASGAAGTDDASSIFFNPATMARLEGRNVTGGLQVLHTNVDFSGKGFYNPSNQANQLLGIGGVSTGNNRHDDLGLTQAIPQAAYSQQFHEKLWFGLTVNVPFGLKTKYDDSWVGRYSAIKSHLKTVNINPALAFRFNERASIGAGVSALYADGELTNAIDGGLIGSLQSIQMGGGPIPGWVPGSSTLDSKAKLTGDDWGYGWNVGLLLEPTERTRFGLQYRSKIDLTLKGDVRVNGPVVNFNDGAKLDLTLPASTSLSAYHELTSKWAIMADVTWTNWDKLDELRVEFDNGGENLTPLDWNNSIRVSLGASYRHNEHWLYRAGFAYDETPVPNARLRTPRVPDEDRYWLSLGARYSHTKDLTFDFAYAHLFVDDSRVKSNDAYDPTTGQTSGFHSLNGDYNSKVDILGVQVNWRF
jgi:long-chain fatty acid transport protein